MGIHNHIITTQTKVTMKRDKQSNKTAPAQTTQGKEVINNTIKTYDMMARKQMVQTPNSKAKHRSNANKTTAATKGEVR